MSDRDLEQVTRLVVRAVSERLGGMSDNRDVMELVVREVVSAMANTAQVPPRSTPQPARDNGDGTVTTALGSVLPMPTQPRTSLELCNGCVEQQRQQSQSRAVVSTTGKNARGVVARVSKEIAEAGGDIQDISQTIVSDYFTMIMLVEISGLSVPFSDFKQRLLQVGEALGIHTVVMHEDVMRSLQRV